MTSSQPWLDDRIVSLPGLVWLADRTCELALLDALRRAAYDDIPANGVYILGRLVGGRATYPLGQLVREMGMSKQAIGQLVDVLVERNYVSRTLSETDRRKLDLKLTDHGKRAAAVLTHERESMTNCVLETVGAEGVQVMRRSLWALLQMRLAKQRRKS